MIKTNIHIMGISSPQSQPGQDPKETGRLPEVNFPPIKSGSSSLYSEEIRMEDELADPASPSQSSTEFDDVLDFLDKLHAPSTEEFEVIKEELEEARHAHAESERKNAELLSNFGREFERLLRSQEEERQLRETAEKKARSLETQVKNLQGQVNGLIEAVNKMSALSKERIQALEARIGTSPNAKPRPRSRERISLTDAHHIPLKIGEELALFAKGEGVIFLIERLTDAAFTVSRRTYETITSPEQPERVMNINRASQPLHLDIPKSAGPGEIVNLDFESKGYLPVRIVMKPAHTEQGDVLVPEVDFCQDLLAEEGADEAETNIIDFADVQCELLHSKAA